MQTAKISFSQLFKHEDYRWDGEYLCFEPYKNPKLKYRPIGSLLRSTQYGISIEMNEEKNGTKIYRMNEISEMFCDRVVSKYAEIDSNEIKSFKLKDRDVLFNRTNSQVFVGRTGLFREFSSDDYVFASYLVRLTPNEKEILPEYLTAFLNTKYGDLDVKRRARISINQSNVNAEEIKRVEIPILNWDLQQQIKIAFDKAFMLIKQSEEEYKEAEEILLAELGLLKWKNKHRLTYVKRISPKNADRIDAEYYQPKYDEIISAVKSYSGGWNIAQKILEFGEKNFYPKDNLEYRYIELSNIGENGEVVGCTTSIGQELPTRARRKVSKDDVIVSSIEGSLSSIALISDDYDNSLCSTGFYVVRSNDLNSETILVFLKCLAGQLQLKKGCSGTILTAIGKDEFEKIIFPLVKNNIQKKIKEKIQRASEIRDYSKFLRNCTKTCVEIAIEKDEQQAMKWLVDQMKNIDLEKYK